MESKFYIQLYNYSLAKLEYHFLNMILLCRGYVPVIILYDFFYENVKNLFWLQVHVIHSRNLEPF